MPNSQENHCQITKQLKLKYALIRTKRRTTSISIKSNAEVVVRAPLETTLALIEKFLCLQAPWIIKKQAQQINKAKIPSPELQDGGKFMLHGQWRFIQIRASHNNHVELVDNQINILQKDKSVAFILDQWLKNYAATYFQARLEYLWPIFMALGYSRPTIRIRKMKSRWGSISSNGRMSLNFYLINAPTVCLDYVIIHELCHLRNGQHDKEYYGFLGILIPNWKEIKRALSIFAK